MQQAHGMPAFVRIRQHLFYRKSSVGTNRANEITVDMQYVLCCNLISIFSCYKGYKTT